MKNFLIGLGILAIAAIAVGGYQYAKADIYGSSLIAYWTLDSNHLNWTTGTAADSSGGGFTGNLQNFSTTSSPVAGVLGQALSFNGTNQMVDVPAFSTNIASAAALSISAWAYPIGSQPSDGGVAGMRNTLDGAGQFYIQLSHFGTVEARINSGGTNYTLSSTPWTANVWQLITLTYDGSTLKLYKNGVFAESIAASGTFGTNGIDFWIGNEAYQHGTFDSYFLGNIDDVRLYTRALSAAEVQTLYYQGISQHSNGDF